MKIILASFCGLLLFTAGCANLSTSQSESECQTPDDLFAQYESLKQRISAQQEGSQKDALEDLKLAVDAAFFDIRYDLSGALFDGETAYNKYFVECIYASFLSDQSRLDRAIRHTDEKPVALQMIRNRTKKIVSLYPLTTPTTFVERMHFLTFLCRTAEHDKEIVEDLLGQNISRWENEDKIPGLLFLAARGDKSAEKELQAYDNKDARSLKTVFKVQMKRLGK